MDSTNRFLGYCYYNIGFGKHGKIPYAISVRSEDVMSKVAKLNNEQGFNVYMRLNANFFSQEPARIRDIDIVRPDLFCLDIDEKNNIGADIEAVLTQFISEKSLTNYLHQFTGHGHQLWMRCNPVSSVGDFKSNARRLKGYIEAETGLVVDFTPNPSRYGRYPGTVNYNSPIRQGRVISWERGEPFDITRCPDIYKKGTNMRGKAVSRGDHQTTPPSGCAPLPKAVPPQALNFIRSLDQRRKVLSVLQNPHPEHRDRVWLVGFLKWCGLSQSRTIALIQSHQRWGDYRKSATKRQVKSVWRSAGRRSRS